MADKKVASGLKMPTQLVYYLLLGITVEIDEYVATENNIERFVNIIRRIHEIKIAES
jgi:hypothetical protein